jgi:hypothetical protein
VFRRRAAAVAFCQNSVPVPTSAIRTAARAPVDRVQLQPVIISAEIPRSQSEMCTRCALVRLSSTTSQIEGTPMTTIRMFAFVAAVLITASFFGVMADAFTAPQHAQDQVAASAQAGD